MSKGTRDHVPPFYNRDRERATLREKLASPRSELVIIYGRRGVGKSALLSQTLTEAGLSHIFFRATRRTLPLQLAALTEAARDAYPTSFLTQPFASISVFLDFLVYLAGEREAAGNRDPVAVVVDELPYLAEADPGLLTTLQHWWDVNKRRPNLKIFLAGSYITFMQRQVLAVTAPLYNRRTAAMQVQALDYAQATLFFPRYSAREKMEAYAILGGMPSYLEQFDPSLTIERNVKATALRPNTYLSEEPDWLLLQDLRQDMTFGSILRAVATGRRKPSDIARAIGKSVAQDITAQLVVLRGLELLVREVPVTEKHTPGSRNSLYLLADNYLDFWYRFVDPSRSLVARGLGAQVWDRFVEPALHDYVSRPAFERACRQYLWRALEAGKLRGDLFFSDVGTWWGARDREIDVVAVDQRGLVTVAGSCKWTNKPVDVAEYAALQRDVGVAMTTRAFPTDDGGPCLALFSREGFGDSLRAIAAQKPSRLLLVGIDDMYDV